VIDDDSDDVEVIDRALSDKGYIALLATSGDEAVRIAEIQQPDLVLLDLRMPRMDGPEVAATIRKLPGMDRTRFVAVSGAPIDDHEQIRNWGFDGFIQKPIDPESFLDQIDLILGERELSS
jgi:CheY-like chemotaxis protein